MNAYTYRRDNPASIKYSSCSDEKIEKNYVNDTLLSFEDDSKMVSKKLFHEIILILLGICSSITIFFSLTVLIILRRHWRTQCRSIVNLLTCNSCVALIFFVITSSIQIPSLIQHLSEDIPPSSILCQIYAFLSTFGTTVEVYSFFIQAISRFFMTILYKHKYLLTYRTNWMLIIISWMMSGIVSVGMFTFPLAYQYEVQSHFCALTTTNLFTALLGNFLIAIIPMMIMTTLYGIILYHTARHTRINPNSTSTLRARRNQSIFKQMLIFVGIFGIGGTCYFLCTILHYFDRAPWPLYSIALLFLAFAVTLISITLFLLNDQARNILLAKLTRCQANTSKKTKRNQIEANALQMRTIQPLAALY